MDYYQFTDTKSPLDQLQISRFQIKDSSWDAKFTAKPDFIEFKQHKFVFNQTIFTIVYESKEAYEN